MKKSANLIFFGNERLSSGFQPHGAPTLQALIDNGYHIKAVVAHHEAGRSRQSRELEVAAVARQHDIPLLLPANPNQIYDQLSAYNPTVGVLVAYGRLIPQKVINLFPRGILNIHPSLLPAYRGPTPIEQAILDGTPKTGVSIMQLAKQMDAGPLFAQSELPLKGTETKQFITEQLLERGGQLLIDVLSQVIAGTTRPTPQQDELATYTSLISKADGRLTWDVPAIEIERKVRAYQGWPKTTAEMYGHAVVITKARVASHEHDGALVIGCNPGWLEVLELTAPSGRNVSGADFLRGYRKIA